MCALHEGHLSLVRLAKEKADKVVVSIFVNPTQFAPHEDFDTYPRDIPKDLKLLQDEGVDLVYKPDISEIYPSTLSLNPSPFREREGAERKGEGLQNAAQGLESDFRPHFFAGVKTVVQILFDQVQPDIAIFGEKDFQQLQVIREMVQTQNLPIEIIGAPIARDKYGLALSSRNAYLSDGELEIARMLNQAIYKAAFDISSMPSSRWHAEGVGINGIQKGQRAEPADIVDPRCLSPAAQDRGDDVNRILNEATQSLLTCGFDKVDYVIFKPEWNRVLAAAWLGKTRLIDNCTV
jgi:pantoate--beta-alanine ligase